MTDATPIFSITEGPLLLELGWGMDRPLAGLGVTGKPGHKPDSKTSHLVVWIGSLQAEKTMALFITALLTHYALLKSPSQLNLSVCNELRACLHDVMVSFIPQITHKTDQLLVMSDFPCANCSKKHVGTTPWAQLPGHNCCRCYYNFLFCCT